MLEGGEIVADRRHMADFAAALHILAIQVDLHNRFRSQHNVGLGHQVVDAPTEDVDHDGPRLACLGRTQRQVQHRADVVLELAGMGAVDRPVTGVVRAHRELVDEDPAVAGLEKLDREDAGDIEFLGNSCRDLPGRLVQTCVQIGSRRDDFFADAVDLAGLDHRVGPRFTRRRPCDQRRELADEVDLLLGDQLAPGGEGFVRVVGSGDDP